MIKFAEGYQACLKHITKKEWSKHTWREPNITVANVFLYVTLKCKTKKFQTNWKSEKIAWEPFNEVTLCIHSRHPLWQLAMINVGNCGRLLTGNWHDPLQSIYKGGIAASSGGFRWWIKSCYQIPYVGSSLFNLNPRTIWLIEPYSTQPFLYLLTPRGGGAHWTSRESYHLQPK